MAKKPMTKKAAKTLVAQIKAAGGGGGNLRELLVDHLVHRIDGYLKECDVDPTKVPDDKVMWLAHDLAEQVLDDLIGQMISAEVDPDEFKKIAKRGSTRRSR